MKALNIRRFLLAAALASLVLTSLGGCVVYDSYPSSYYAEPHYRPYYYRPYYYGYYYRERPYRGRWD